MTMRMRKLAGTVILLLLIVVYSLIAVTVAWVLQMQNANKALELAYYVVAGTLWIVPAGAVIWWMQRSDGPAT